MTNPWYSTTSAKTTTISTTTRTRILEVDGLARLIGRPDGAGSWTSAAVTDG